MTWNSSNDGVVTVTGGRLKAVQAGSATITAKAGSKSATCSVTVEKPFIAVTSVTCEGARQNFEKALKFYEKTFNKGDGRTPYHREAAKKVMWMYELGEGIPQDKIKAAEWRKKLGDSDEE